MRRSRALFDMDSGMCTHGEKVSGLTTRLYSYSVSAQKEDCVVMQRVCGPPPLTFLVAGGGAWTYEFLGEVSLDSGPSGRTGKLEFAHEEAEVKSGLGHTAFEKFLVGCLDEDGALRISVVVAEVQKLSSYEKVDLLDLHDYVYDQVTQAAYEAEAGDDL